jgi:cation diffusion facilitator family transporter
VSHSQSAESQHSGSVKVIFFALFANLGIAIAKLVGSFFTGSASLLAEAIHSFVDCTNQVFLLLGNKKSLKKPDEKHPLGYGRESFFWSFIVAIFLFSMGGLFAIYEGIHKIQEADHELEYPLVGLSILLFGVILEGFSFAACIKEIRLTNPGVPLRKWFKEAGSSELLVIFAEDLAALLGLIIAMVSLALAWITHHSIYDAFGSIAVGLLLCFVSFFLAKEIKALMIGEAPNKDYKKFIDQQWVTLTGNGKLLKIIAIQTGSNEVMLSCKLHPGQIKETSQLIALINQLEVKIKAQFPEIKWSFVEPDMEE